MQLTAYDSESVFEALQPEWNDLLHRSTCDMIFSTWEWQSAWWEAYCPGELWVVTCRTDEGRLVGLAPWFIEPHPEAGERVVRSIGCVDVTDYVDIIVEPEFRESVFAGLAAHLHEHRQRYDRINLCNIPEASPTHQEFSKALKDQGFDVEVVLQEVCPVIPLPDDWEGYLASLDKKQRHEIRRKIRRAESEADTQWYIVGQEHDLEAELERFLSLMSASQRQKAEFLTDSKNRAFFRIMVPRTFANDWLQLCFLTINNQVAAGYLNFDYKGRVLVYNSGLQPDMFGHLSPGIVLLAYTIQHAIETGHEVYDFLRGNETYKYRMGAGDTRVFKLKAQWPG